MMTLGIQSALVVSAEERPFNMYNVRESEELTQDIFGVTFTERGPVMQGIEGSRLVPRYYHEAINCYVNATYLGIIDWWSSYQAGLLTKDSTDQAGVVAQSNKSIQKILEDAIKTTFFDSELRRFALDPFCTKEISVASELLEMYQEYYPGDSDIRVIMNRPVVQRVKRLYNPDGVSDLSKALTLAQKQIMKTDNTGIFFEESPRSLVSNIMREEFWDYEIYLNYLRDSETVSLFSEDVSYYANYDVGNPGDGKLKVRPVMFPADIEKEREVAVMLREIVAMTVDEFSFFYPVHLQIQTLKKHAHEAVEAMDDIAVMWRSLAPKLPVANDSDR